MSKKLVYLICFVLVLGLFGSVAQARPLVYEPFDYASIGDSLNGKFGDAIGLSGAWSTLTGGAVREFLLVDDLGPHGVLPTAGNAVKRLAPGRSSAHRPIDGSIRFPSTNLVQSPLQGQSGRHGTLRVRNLQHPIRRENLIGGFSVERPRVWIQAGSRATGEGGDLVQQHCRDSIQ